MPIVREPEGREFPLAPEGLHNAVCVDVWPIWTDERPAQFGGGLVDKTAIVWQTEDIDPATGLAYEVAKFYTASLHEKANLRKDLESWRGRRFTTDELKGFELDNVIGASCQLQLLHNVSQKNGKTYANIQGIMPLAKGSQKVQAAPGYVRKKDRPANPGKANPHGHGPGLDEDEEAVPF